MKFTPGPWEAVRMATNHEVQEANGVQVIADVYSAGTGTHEANAQLIAAAPDLYEALKMACEHTNGELQTLCLKALAKAEGKER